MATLCRVKRPRRWLRLHTPKGSLLNSIHNISCLIPRNLNIPKLTNATTFSNPQHIGRELTNGQEKSVLQEIGASVGIQSRNLQSLQLYGNQVFCTVPDPADDDGLVGGSGW